MSKSREESIKGVKIGTVNYAMVLITCVLYVLVIWATVQVSIRYKTLSEVTENYIACERDAAQVHEGSDYLTEQVRLYAVTMEPLYVDNYFNEVNVTRRRDLALEDLRNYDPSEEAYNYLQTALERSNQLIEREVYSMRMITVAMGYKLEDFPVEVQEAELSAEDASLGAKEMLEKGRSMVFDAAYQDAKRQIMSNIDYFLDSIVGETRADHLAREESLERIMLAQRIFISLLCVMNIAMFLLIMHLIIRPLEQDIQCIQEEREMDLAGSYEFKNLAVTYNGVHEGNLANEALLRHKAEHDPLTGIINRGGFDKMRQLMKNKNVPMALLLIDVDNFKQVNDTYGHETGDQVLKKVAKLLQDSFRSKDYAARIGGDEFAVIMTSITPELRSVIHGKVNAINNALTNPEDGLPTASVSVGVAFSPHGFSDELFPNSDKALYLVKKNGRCGCEFFSGV